MTDMSKFFQNWFYTEASCGPSRAALLTGLYPGLRGVFGLQHITKNLTNGNIYIR